MRLGKRRSGGDWSPGCVDGGFPTPPLAQPGPAPNNGPASTCLSRGDHARGWHRERLVTQDSSNIQAKEDLAWGYQDIGEVQSRSNPAAALELVPKIVRDCARPPGGTAERGR